jgi:hypothetical protein
VGFQPALNGVEVLARQTELRADLLRREPLVIPGGSGRVVHAVDQFAQCRLTLRGALEHEQHMIELHGVGHRAAVVLGAERRRRRVALQRYELRFNDALGKNRLGILRHGCRRTESQKNHGQNR